MKEFKLYYFSSEAGGIWERCCVYAHNLKEAVSMVKNLKYCEKVRSFAE